MARKRMSEEQRLAAVERLAKAREVRGHDGSKSVHEDLRSMDEDSPIHWKKVKTWIKEIGEELRSMRHKKTSKNRKERGEYWDLEVYHSNLKKYLVSGIYHDIRYGRLREGKMKTIVKTMAYHSDGWVKRTVGHYYPDIDGGLWTQEMHNDYERCRREEVSKQEVV